jgi:hypothetical protein
VTVGAAGPTATKFASPLLSLVGDPTSRSVSLSRSRQIAGQSLTSNTTLKPSDLRAPEDWIVRQQRHADGVGRDHHDRNRSSSATDAAFDELDSMIDSLPSGDCDSFEDLLASTRSRDLRSVRVR